MAQYSSDHLITEYLFLDEQNFSLSSNLCTIATKLSNGE